MRKTGEGPDASTSRIIELAEQLSQVASGFTTIDNLEAVEWVMRGGRIWRPGQLRSGIAMK